MDDDGDEANSELPGYSDVNDGVHWEAEVEGGAAGRPSSRWYSSEEDDGTYILYFFIDNDSPLFLLSSFL
jgi:hypothetical protein